VLGEPLVEVVRPPSAEQACQERRDDDQPLVHQPLMGLAYREPRRPSPIVGVLRGDDQRRCR